MRKRTAAHPAGSAPATAAAGYRTGAHTLHRLRLHLVWVPKCKNTKYRKRVLRGPVAARLEALLRQACEVKAWGLHEISVPPGHVHVLLQIAPTDSVMAVMQSLKGGTSRVLRAESPELEEFLWGESFWSDGDFADGDFADGDFAGTVGQAEETVGQAEEAVVRASITPLKPPRPGPPERSGSVRAQAKEAARVGPAPPPPWRAHMKTGTSRS